MISYRIQIKFYQTSKPVPGKLDSTYKIPQCSYFSRSLQYNLDDTMVGKI